MKRPFMQEDLREHKLLAVLDLLMETEEPLTVGQIQYRLGRDRNVEMSRDEIEAHLKWGLHQPGATNAPVRPVPHPQDTWIVVAKIPSTAEETEAAGPPPFDVSKRAVSLPDKPRPGDTTETYLTRELNKMTNDRASEAWNHMNPKERKKALGGITTEYGVDSSWEQLTSKDRAIVSHSLETKVKPRMSEYSMFNCKDCGRRCRVWKGSPSYEKRLCAECLDAAGLGVPLRTISEPEHPPIRYLIWFRDGSNITRTGTEAELAERYGTAIKIEEL